MNRGMTLPPHSQQNQRWYGPILHERLNHHSRLVMNLDFGVPRGRSLLGAFTGVNWSSFTRTDIDDTVPGQYFLDHPGAAGTSHRGMMTPIPTGDFDAVLHFSMFDRVADGMGIYLSSGVTAGAGTQNGSFPSYLGSGVRRSVSANYTNWATYSSTQWAEYGSEAPSPFIRVNRTGAVYSVRLSYDGRIWSVAATITPSGTMNYVGFGFFTSASATRRMSVKSFRIWQPSMPDDALGVFLPPFSGGGVFK